MLRPCAMHIDRVAQAHHRLHDMFDDQDGDTAAAADGLHHRHHVPDFGRVEAGQHLVKQAGGFGLGGERAGEFQPLSASDRELAGRLIEQRPETNLMTNGIRDGRARP
jgi:hypothetical protein